MEHAGTAVAAAVRALATDLGRWGTGPIVILCGPGNNGGDGFVAARRLALAGASVIVAVVAADARPRGRRRRPGTGTASRATRGSSRSTRRSPATSRCSAIGVEKAAVVVDALLGTGVRGALREPIRSAVEVIGRARAAGVPVVAVDTPTAVDLSSGEPSDPAVIADLTVTFHRPKTGLLTRRGAALRRQGPRRADRHPGRGRPWLSRAASGGSRAGARSSSSPAVAVAVVLGAAVLTSVLPTGLQEVVFHTPLAIVVLDRRDRLAAVADRAPAARLGRSDDRAVRDASPGAIAPLERRAADLADRWPARRGTSSSSVAGSSGRAPCSTRSRAGCAPPSSSRTTSPPARRRARRG